MSKGNIETFFLLQGNQLAYILNTATTGMQLKARTRQQDKGRPTRYRYTKQGQTPGKVNLHRGNNLFARRRLNSPKIRKRDRAQVQHVSCSESKRKKNTSFTTLLLHALDTSPVLRHTRIAPRLSVRCVLSDRKINLQEIII